MSSWANASSLNKNPVSLYSSDKVKGGCKSCWAAILLGFVLVIGIIVVCVIGVKEASNKGYCSLFGSKHNDYMPIKFPIMNPNASAIHTMTTPKNETPVITPLSEENEKESFVNNLSLVYARKNTKNPLMPNKARVYKQFADNFDSEALVEDAKSSFMGGFGFENKMLEKDSKNEENVMLEVNKASDSGRSDGATRKLIGDMFNTKLSALYSSHGGYSETQPVKGFSTANGRVNNTMIGALTIDDRGEGVQPSEVPAVESFTPTISCNSRLAGSAMDIEALTGACFKKYDTETFFENNTPLPPKLNIMEGGPQILKYKVNDTM